jgi:outer membrane receptor protein involved in Fe transport
MKHFLLSRIFPCLFAGLFFTLPAWAQHSLTGSLKDSVLEEPLPYASLLLQSTNGYNEGKNADSLGHFEFKNLPEGSYQFSAFYVGYPKLEKTISITPSSPQRIALGNLYMEGNNMLKAVKIVDFRDLIEQRPDGIVYLADKDPSNAGTTAEELLRKVPMLTVDMDGNVQMRGNGNIKVLIDGKPSTIIAASVSDALKQIPSDNIKSVEVISSPGAKYDAEGTAGVINIITKKNIIKGISGSVYSGLKYRFKQQDINGHGGFNLNYRNNKFGLAAHMGGGHWSNLSESNSARTSYPGSANESALIQSVKNEGGGTFYWGGLSADYEFDSLNTVQAGFNLNPGNWKTDMDQHTSYPGKNIDYNRDISMESPRSGYSANASYNRKFKNNPKRTLDILTLYSVNNTDNNYNLVQQDNLTGIENYKEKNKNKAENKEFAAQVDYAQPLKKHQQKIETGLKYINRNVGSDYEFYNWSAGSGDDFTLDPARTNALNYVQQVAAAYGQFSSALTKSLSAIAGLRYEYTNIQGALRDNGGKFTSDFNNLLPSAILSWDLKHFNKLKLSYDERIQRPSIEYINPYIDYSDPYNIKQGNPRLEPELTHNIELGFSTMKGHTSLNLSGFYRNTNNAIEAITEVGSDGVSRTTYGNIARNNSVGINAFGATSLFNRWMINVNGNVYYKNLYSPSLAIRNDGFEYDFHVFSTVKVSEKFSVDGFVMYRGNQVMLQGSQDGFYYYRLGVKETILKGKGTITLSAENFFTPSLKINADYAYQNTVYHNETNSFYRGVRIGFNYRFGKMKFSAPKKTIENNDLKQGQDQQQGVGNQMGG